MEIEQGTVQSQLLLHAERQTRALETIKGILTGMAVVALIALALVVLVTLG